MSDTILLPAEPFLFLEGTALCSGAGTINAPAPGSHLQNSYLVTRWCFSGLSGPGGWAMFFATPLRLPATATLTVTIDGEREIGSDYSGLFSVEYSLTGFHQNIFGELINGVRVVNDVGTGQRTGTVSLPVPFDWTQFVVFASIVGSVNSAFSNFPFNYLTVLDCYITVPAPPRGLSFSSTHGSGGGGFIGTTNSLSI